MFVILSKKSQSGAELAESLDIPLTRNVAPYDEDVFSFVIRWGSTLEYDGVQLNTADGVRNASNKPKARWMLQDAEVKVPLTRFSVPQADRDIPYPIVCRRPQHRAGSGFWLVQNRVRLERAYRRGARYFSEYFPKTAEYRVHVGRLTSGEFKIILVSVKEGGDTSRPYWNHNKSGFNLRHLHRHVWREDELLNSMTVEATRAIDTLGLDFGAVDVLVNEDEQEFTVCEVNTTPAMSPLALSHYTRYFQGWLDVHEDEGIREDAE